MSLVDCTDDPCNHCDAECCKYLAIAVNPNDQAYIQYLMTHGGKLSTSDCKGNLAVILVDHVCKQLKDNRCSIYEDRPDICREYDAFSCPDATLKGSRRKIADWPTAQRFLSKEKHVRN